MKLELKILISWILVLAILRLVLFIPHRYIDPLAFLNAGVQLLLCIIAVLISINSRTGQRYVFINFALFFFYVVPMLASSFVGPSLFSNFKYATVYYTIFVNKIGLNFILLLSIVFSVTEYLKPGLRTYQKYILSVLVAGTIVFVFYHPFEIDPMKLYTEAKYVLLGKMETAEKSLSGKTTHEPNDDELLKNIQAIDQASGRATSEENSVPVDLRSVRQLHPYLERGGETVIFWRPVNLAVMYADGIVMLILIIFLILLYKLGKPHSAYTDKVLILFLVLTVLDTLHTYGATSSNSSIAYLTVWRVSHFITIACSFLMVYALDKKLRFTLSAAGRYYEEALIISPAKVSVYRDEIDTLIMKSFFLRNKLSGRLVDITSTIDKEKHNKGIQ